jgi:hypothetical protein
MMIVIENLFGHYGQLVHSGRTESCIARDNTNLCGGECVVEDVTTVEEKIPINKIVTSMRS